jgi:alanine or glycine:cation symporter, AGCS family
MDFFLFISTLVSDINAYLSYPSLIIFLGTAIILTIKNRFLQIRGFPRFVRLVSHGIRKQKFASKAKTLSSIQALFSAMATTIGMGNIVGPSVAISVGGPGALFWLLIYIILGSATKFTEVTFSVYTRTVTTNGDIIGGPTQYLKLISHKLALWYAILTIFLFTGWSALQVNTLASIWAQEGIPHWITGLIASLILLLVVFGGVKRIGFFASRIVPLKFVLYILFAILILIKNSQAVGFALKLIITSVFTPIAALGGFAGATIFAAMREGIYKSIFITEAGIGTSSISHALANVERPSDQGILAMFSGLADMFLCTLSGLLTLVTGVWTSGKLNNTLTYEAFKINAPAGGRIVLIVSILLFVITALIGNTYNGSQSFASLTKYKYVNWYYFIAAIIAFLGALANVPLLWQIMDILLAIVAIPHLVGLVLLAFKFPHILKK